MPNNLIFMSFNVKGINNPIKRKKILNFLKNQDCSIAFIQESHLTDAEHLKLKRDWVGSVFYSSFNSRSRGVAILCHKHIELKIISQEKDSAGRWIILKCDINREPFTLINLYGPNKDDANFFRNILLSSTQKYGTCIMGGDYNLTLSTSDRSNRNPQPLSTSAKVVREGMLDLGLVDVWRVLNPLEREYSFYSVVHDSHSRIDLFLTSKTLLHNVIECKYLASTISDHSPLKLKVKQYSDRPKTKRWRFQTDLLNDVDFVSFLENQIEDFLKINVNSASPSTVWEALKAFLRGQISSFGAFKQKKSRQILNTLDKEIHELEKKHAETNQAEILHILRKKRLEHSNLTTRQAETDMARTKYHYYENGDKTGKLLSWQIRKEEAAKTIDSIKTNEGEVLSKPEEINQRFETFYHNLYKSENQDSTATKCENFLGNLPITKLTTDVKNNLEAEISKEEITIAVNSLQSGKAPGPDGLPSEFYKHFLNKLIVPYIDMIKDSIKNGKLPPSLELATINVFPKPSKDKQLCDSYRPLSMLNVDYKIFSKVLALRMEPVMPFLIHEDQTGFIQQRQGSDNIRKLFHVIELSKQTEESRFVISMDARKAFDTIEFEYLFYTLRQMNFGDVFINYIKMLYCSPKAQVLTNGVLSKSFQLGRGVRQGCPLSVYLFAAAIEPLAVAIRNNGNVRGITTGTIETKLSLYCDDLLIYITRPDKSLPQLLKILDAYSAISGYSINYDKSEIMPLNCVTTQNAHPLVSHFKWAPTSFKYLGIQISNDLNQTYQKNYLPVMEKIKTDLYKWKDLPISLIGRVNVVKMNVLPKLIYLFQSIPLSCPTSLFISLNKIISTFLWSQKRARISLKALQAPLNKGGLNLPNFRLYYLACQSRVVWCWLNSERMTTPAWVKLETNIIHPTPIQVIPYIDIQNLKVITKNQIIHHTFACWKEFVTTLGAQKSLLMSMPLWNNPCVPKVIRDGIGENWRINGIEKIRDLYTQNTFIDFNSLRTKFNLPPSNFFKYLQIRNWVKKNSSSYPYITETPLEKLFNTSKSSKGLVSKVYTLLNSEKRDDKILQLKNKWENDTQQAYTLKEWQSLLQSAQTTLTNTKHRLIQFNILHRIYYTPYRLYQFSHETSPKCLRCQHLKGDLIHTFWKCQKLNHYWKFIFEQLTKILEKNLIPDVRIAILGDVTMLKNFDSFEKKLILLAMAAAKKCILCHWKSENPPPTKQWWAELLSYCTPEKIMYQVKGKPSHFQKIWGRVMDYIPVMERILHLQ